MTKKGKKSATSSNGNEHWYNNGWVSGIVVAVVFLFVGYWWSQYQENKSPKRLGETGVVDDFVIRVSDFKCARATKSVDTLNDNEDKETQLDYQTCVGPMTALNTTNQTDNLYTDVILFVGDDRYKSQDNNLLLDTNGIFPHQRKEGEIKFDIPLGAVPTMLVLKSSSEELSDMYNPFDINDVRYDLR